MPEIGIGIVGGGYMGKVHTVAMTAVGAVFNTALRPRLEMICASTPASAERYRTAYGFARATDDWASLVDDANVDAVVIASPQSTHRAIAEAALARGKPVFCEKPLGASLEDSRAMVAAAEKVGVANMVGFNYVRTPATLLDTGVAHQYYFIAQRFPSGGGSVPILVPQAGRQYDLNVTEVGSETIVIGGVSLRSRRLRLEGNQETREIWLDSQGRVLKVEHPGGGYSALRETAP
jgi:hypothetical protein